MAVKKNNKELFYEQLVNDIKRDFSLRREERRSFEQQWNLNLNFLMGNQYTQISPCGEVEESEKEFYWQGRNVYNHIAPIIETRLCKLSRVRPIMSVRASGDEESDLKCAKLATSLLNSTFSKLGLSDVIYKATLWSEVAGTSFYKIMWDNNSGRKIGKVDGKEVYEGDVKIIAVSPYDIFPDSIFHEDIGDLKSIIHAKAMHVDEVYAIYGKMLKGEDIDVFSLSSTSVARSGEVKPKVVSGVAHDNVLVIERYEMPNQEFPNGRVVTIANDEILSISDLPYENGDEKRRVLPFIRQVAINQVGCFFGISVIERIIPIQRAYNAVKNRKHEYLNRISMGVLTVEDGSVDADSLVEDGLSPGKVLVYRQGSIPPKIMSSASVPPDFSYEEKRLEEEFINVSGVSEFSRNSATLNENISGVAIELMIEQDDTRLITSAENIRNAVKIMGKMIIRLFKQFAASTRLLKVAGGNNGVELYYFNGSELNSDDVVFDTENELSYTPAQKKNAIYNMIKTGLLYDKDGNLSMRTKSKILELIGFGTLASGQDITNLHIDKAQKENITMAKQDVDIEEFDDNEVHIVEHTRFLISEKFDNNKKHKERVLNHLRLHKMANKEIQGGVNYNEEK